MNGFVPTLVGFCDYRLVTVSVPEATNLLQALECLCLEVTK
jgi:hypothetical protein